MAKYDVQLSTGHLEVVDADSISAAVDTAIWEHSHDAYILAVYPTGRAVPVWRLVYIDGLATEPFYFTLDEALANNDTGTEILTAIPAS